MSQIILETGTNAPALAANSSNANILAGSAFEFAARPSRVDVGLVADLTGVTSRVQFGSTIEVESYAIPVWVTVSRGPIVPDDIFVRGIALGGNRLVVQLQNTTAATRIVRCLVSIVPLR